MVGTVIIIVVLLLAPVGILLSTSVFAAVFTSLVNRDVDISHEGSELLTLAEIGVDLRVLGFTIVISALLALGFSAIPARRAVRRDLQRSLGHGVAGVPQGPD